MREIGAAAGLGGRGLSIAREARRILLSQQKSQLRDMSTGGRQASGEIGGKAISFGRDLPTEGKTNASKTFHPGQYLWSSSEKLTKKVLREFRRARHHVSIDREGVSRATTVETRSAHELANRAFAVWVLLR